MWNLINFGGTQVCLHVIYNVKCDNNIKYYNYTVLAVRPLLPGTGMSADSASSLPSDADGKRIPTELRKEEAQLRDSMAFDDVGHEGQWTCHMSPSALLA